MNKKSKKEKRPFLGKIKWFFVVIIILFISLIASAMFFEEEIGSIAIQTVKDQIQTEVDVDYVSLSFIRSFPQASVSLHKVLIRDQKRDTLLFLDDFSLQCSIWDIFKGDYEFKGLYAGKGKLNIHVDQRGQTNFKGLWKQKDQPTDFRMSISNAQLEKIAIQYQNLQTNQFFKGYLNNGVLTGDFIIDNARNMNLHTIHCHADLSSDQLVANSATFLNDQQIDLRGEIIVDNANELFEFDDLSVWVNNDEFIIDGAIEGTEKGSLYSIQSTSQSARLSTLLACVPLSQRNIIHGIESYADVSFEATIQGEYTLSRLPEIRVNCQFNGGRITHPRLSGSLRDVSFAVQYSNGNGYDPSTQIIEINTFKSTLNGEPITMDFEMTGSSNPYVNLTLDGTFSMSSLYSMFGDNITDGFGDLQIDSLILSGYVSDMFNIQKVYKVKQRGSIYPKQVGLEVNGVALSVDAGEVNIQNNETQIKHLQLSTRYSMIDVSGIVNNLLPFLFSVETTLSQSKLKVDLDVNIAQMDVEELWRLGGGYSKDILEETNKDSIIQSSFSKREQLLDRLQGQLVFHGTDIVHPRFTSDQVSGLISVRDGVMQLKNGKVNAYGGSFDVNSRLYFTQAPHGVIFVDAKNVDVYKLFEQTQSFGQDVLTHQHLKGRLDAIMKMDVFFDSTGQFDDNRFFMLADVLIKDGELNDFELMESFAKYIKIQDLQRIKFTELSNQFKIENRQLFVPAMFIQSNASNLLVGGVYTFDHDVDFKIKINAGQLFFNNFKKYNPQRRPLKARKNGLFNVYAQIYGNMMDGIEYRLGPKFAKKALENELSVQLPAIHNSLKEEFSPFQNNGERTPIRILRQPEDWEDALLEDMGDLEYIQW